MNEQCEMKVEGDADEHGVLPIRLYLDGLETEDSVSLQLIRRGVALPLKLGMFRGNGWAEYDWEFGTRSCSGSWFAR